MRQGQQNQHHNNNNKNRMRGRNRKGPNPLTRSYESNGGDVKIRGTALHVAEKYVQLARDAQASGDRVASENYFQHAEHYYRIVAAAQAQMPQPQQIYRADGDGDDDEEGGDNVQNNQGYGNQGYGGQGYGNQNQGYGNQNANQGGGNQNFGGNSNGGYGNNHNGGRQQQNGGQGGGRPQGGSPNYQGGQQNYGNGEQPYVNRDAGGDEPNGAVHDRTLHDQAEVEQRGDADRSAGEQPTGEFRGDDQGQRTAPAGGGNGGQQREGNFQPRRRRRPFRDQYGERGNAPAQPVADAAPEPQGED
jgi:hypothetical protein